MGSSSTFRWLESRCHRLVRRLLHTHARAQSETTQVCDTVRSSLLLPMTITNTSPASATLERLARCLLSQEGVLLSSIAHLAGHPAHHL